MRSSRAGRTSSLHTAEITSRSRRPTAKSKLFMPKARMPLTDVHTRSGPLPCHMTASSRTPSRTTSAESMVPLSPCCRNMCFTIARWF